MKLFQNIFSSIKQHSDRNAFCINGTFHAYAALEKEIARVRQAIRNKIDLDEKDIGLVANDDLTTYAAILAIWFEGLRYIPLNPDSPIAHHENIINQVGIKTVIDSSRSPTFDLCNKIDIDQFADSFTNDALKPTEGHQIAYTLFTSGTSGEPKGVPITRDGLSNIMDALEDEIKINSEDRCLQMSELTFDVSISSFVYPLLHGACIYTIPKGKIKFSYIYELIERHQLTIIQLVPSVLNYLRPYFEEISFPWVRYCVLTAEALPLALVKEWAQCIANAVIKNFYGPTENTIWSSAYTYNSEGDNSSHNGILSIGKFLKGTSGIIIDENNQILPIGKKGELCLSGIQLTPGYLHKPHLTERSFFMLDGARFYRTGDLCYRDAGENILFVERIDLQVKVQGFRVELSEIEFQCKQFLKNINVIALVVNGIHGNQEIAIAIESLTFDKIGLIDYLRKQVPPYMVPSRIVGVDRFLVNTNGKVDRNKLTEKFYF